MFLFLLQFIFYIEAKDSEFPNGIELEKASLEKLFSVEVLTVVSEKWELAHALTDFKSVQSFISHVLTDERKKFLIQMTNMIKLWKSKWKTMTARSRVEEEFRKRTAWMNCIFRLSRCEMSAQKKAKDSWSDNKFEAWTESSSSGAQETSKLYQKSKRMGRVSERYLTRTFINVFKDIFHYHILPRLLTKNCVFGFIHLRGKRIKNTLWQSEEEIIHLVINSNWKAGKDGAEY